MQPADDALLQGMHILRPGDGGITSRLRVADARLSLVDALVPGLEVPGIAPNSLGKLGASALTPSSLALMVDEVGQLLWQADLNDAHPPLPSKVLGTSMVYQKSAPLPKHYDSCMRSPAVYLPGARLGGVSGKSGVAERTALSLAPACCINLKCRCTRPSPVPGQAMRLEIWRPSSSIRLSAWTATSTSVARRSSSRDCSPSPITCFHPATATSARARVLSPGAICQLMRPCPKIHWRWRSRGVGARSAVSLGAGVRDGSGDEASGRALHGDARIHRDQ